MITGRQVIRRNEKEGMANHPIINHPTNKTDIKSARNQLSLVSMQPRGLEFRPANKTRSLTATQLASQSASLYSHTTNQSTIAYQPYNDQIDQSYKFTNQTVYSAVLGY